MTPSIMVPAMSASCLPRLTVAQRKEANELRKTLKPLMEKRRRARINESLSRLKTLILPLTGKDNSRYSKLEKADILEMTVRFLGDLPSAPSKSPSDSYKEGYKACLQRVSSLLPKTHLLDADMSQRLNEYLQQTMTPCQTCSCSGQNSRAASQMNPTPLSFVKTTKPKDALSSSNDGSHHHLPQARPQTPSASMWRPW
ncbi:transcription factor HES-2-like [Arapaima gigas]